MTKKHELKAQKRVSKALGVFSKAVAEVEKAQDILEAGVISDTNEIESLKEQVEALELTISEVMYRKSSKNAQIAANEDLLAKLNHFNIEE